MNNKKTLIFDDGILNIAKAFKEAGLAKENVLSLNLWEGDKYFLELINNNSNFFSMKLTYKSDELIGVIIDGKKVL
jgi:hypothetical protein